MRTKGIQRIRDWTVGRLRRAGNDPEANEQEQSHRRPAPVRRLLGWFERVAGGLWQPRRRVLLRWLTFVFLIGAAYGLWQGSQDFIAPGGSLLSNEMPPAEPSATVPEPAEAAGGTSLAGNLPLPLTGNVAQAQSGEPEQAAPRLPDILDLSQVVWPVTGGVEGAYGWYRDPATEAWRFRSGLILKPDRDPAPVRASLPGEVVSVDTSGIGYRVVLSHAEGWVSEYVGLAAVAVHAGMRVEAGDTIGEFAFAPHRDGLHYTLRDASGQPTDPSRILYTPAVR